MLRFVLRKMISKKWMLLALLVGNILLVSIAAGNPMYTQAVLQRTLTKQLENYLAEKNAYPGLVSFAIDGSAETLGQVKECETVAQSLKNCFGVEALEFVRHLYLPNSRGEMTVPRGELKNASLTVASMSDLEKHTLILAGEMYSEKPDEAGVVDVIVSERCLINSNLILGDILVFPKIPGHGGAPLQIRISGVYTYASGEDIYWVRDPAYYYDTCFMPPGLFAEYFLSSDELPVKTDGIWYALLDYTAMRGDQAASMLALSDELEEAWNTTYTKNFRNNFSDVLRTYLKTAQKVNVTLWVLQAPIFALLAAFIFMVSRQMLEMEQNEIAVIKSRGAGRGQIFSIYLLQSLLIALLSLGAGIPLGAYLCQVIGASNAFLEFVRRSALPVEIHRDALIIAGIAAAFSVVAMVVPALRYSKTSIVGHKRRKNNRHSDTPLWQKMGLDFVVLGVALYGLYSFSGQKEMLAVRVLEGASLDPLLFLSSSFFMLGAGLVAVRILPLFVWIVFRLFRKAWSPALYASFMRVLRTRSSQGFIMVFLIMTIALGVFNSQAARTINQNTEDNLYYSVGADMVVKEQWPNNGSELDAMDPTAAQKKLEYTEPDFTRYENLEGAAAAARVYVNDKVTASVKKGSLNNVCLMAIHTREFGETAWFKDSLSDIHWYHYLNAMAQNSRSVLLSRNFQTTYGFKLGDAITYKNAAGDSLWGVIYGFVDYFPGFVPVEYKQGTDGVFKETENFLIVANLQQVQASWGVTPYEIWLKNEDGSDYLYEFAEKNPYGYTQFEDSAAMLVEKKNDAVLQGTNGILTVGFVVVLMLCSVGFLIYWILSIQSRSLQFGIFRAMGMTMREVISMLINEQIFISGLPIAVGAVVGHFTAKLYMPLIQLAYAASDHAIPLEVLSHSSDYTRLLVIIGGVILLCMVVLGILISKLKIAQALKLGED